MKPFLCLIGRHKWKLVEGTDGLHKCEKCPKQKLVIYAILYEDAVRKGASQEAIDRGYVTSEDFKDN